MNCKHTWAIYNWASFFLSSGYIKTIINITITIQTFL